MSFVISSKPNIATIQTDALIKDFRMYMKSLSFSLRPATNLVNLRL